MSRDYSWPSSPIEDVSNAYGFDIQTWELMQKVKNVATRRLKGETHDVQLHLEMDVKSYALLKWLMGSLEAASIGEVIRRALQVFEVFVPYERNQGAGRPANAPIVEAVSTAAIEPKVKRIHVRVPLRTKDRLDKATKTLGGATYSDAINQSLQVLAQLVRNQGATMKGSTNALSKENRRPDNQNSNGPRYVSRRTSGALF